METHNFYKEKSIKPDTVWINGRIEPAQEMSHAYFHLAKEDIGTFMNFSKSDHQLPTKFAVNPKNINIPLLDKLKKSFVNCGGLVFGEMPDLQKVTPENLEVIDK